MTGRTKNHIHWKIRVGEAIKNHAMAQMSCHRLEGVLAVITSKQLHLLRLLLVLVTLFPVAFASGGHFVSQKHKERQLGPMINKGSSKFMNRTSCQKKKEIS